MAAVGSVTIGRQIDIHAFTGEVISVSRRSDTTTTYEQGEATKSETWKYIKLLVRAPDGATQEAEVDARHASAAQGDQVTLFWGVVGTKQSNYLAVYNHTSDKLGIVWETRNDLAGPAILRSQFVLTTLFLVFVLAFIVTSGVVSYLVLGMVVGLWYYLHRRRQTLVAAVQAAIPGLKAQLRAT